MTEEKCMYAHRLMRLVLGMEADLKGLDDIFGDNARAGFYIVTYLTNEQREVLKEQMRDNIVKKLNEYKNEFEKL